MIVVALAISGALTVGAGVALVVTWARVIADAAYYQSITEHQQTMAALKRTVRGN